MVWLQPDMGAEICSMVVWKTDSISVRIGCRDFSMAGFDRLYSWT